MTATVDVTVLPNVMLSPGTALWTVSTAEDGGIDGIRRGLPGMNGTTYMLERTGSGGQVLSVADDDGIVAWSVPIPMASTGSEFASLAAGDSLGGVLLNVEVNNSLGQGTAIVHVDENAEGAWRRDGVVLAGQAGDGTIYATETSDNGRAQWVVILDGETGAERGRVELARFIEWGEISSDTPGGPGDEFYLTGTGGFLKLAIDSAGTAHVLVTSHEDHYDNTVHTTVHEWTTRLELWRITPTGAVSKVLLATDTGTGTARSERDYRFMPQVIVTDDDNSAVVTWVERWSERVPGGPNEIHDDARFARVALDAGVAAPVPLPTGFVATDAVMGEQNTFFVSVRGSEVAALDSITGSIRWFGAGTGLVASTAGGGLVVRDGDFEKTYDHDGVVLSTVLAPADGLLGLDTRFTAASQSLTSFTGEPVDWADVGWSILYGGMTSAMAPDNCRGMVYRKLVSVTPYKFRYTFNSLSPGFDPSRRSIINAAAALWTNPGLLEPGYPTLEQEFESQLPIEQLRRILISWFPFHNLNKPGDDRVVGTANYPYATPWMYSQLPGGRQAGPESIQRQHSPTPLTGFGMLLDVDFLLPAHQDAHFDRTFKLVAAPRVRSSDWARSCA